MTRPLPLAARIFQGRERKTLTQAELAQKLGVAPRTVERWEAGEVIPRARHIDALAVYLDLDRVELEKQRALERWDRRPGPRRATREAVETA